MGEVIYVDFKNKKVKLREEKEAQASDTDLEKLEYFTQLIDRGLTQVLVNTLHFDVILPDHMIGNPALPINWSHKFRLRDFNYDPQGVRGTLTFNSKATFVELPWESIWLIYRPDEGKESSRAWREHAPLGLIELTEELE